MELWGKAETRVSQESYFKICFLVLPIPISPPSQSQPPSTYPRWFVGHAWDGFTTKIYQNRCYCPATYADPHTELTKIAEKLAKNANSWCLQVSVGILPFLTFNLGLETSSLKKTKAFSLPEHPHAELVSGFL